MCFQELKKMLMGEEALKGIAVENLGKGVLKRFQQLNLYTSATFSLSKGESMLPPGIYYPTYKKIVENILEAKSMEHKRTGSLLFNLIIANPSYRYYRASFHKCSN